MSDMTGRVEKDRNAMYKQLTEAENDAAWRDNRQTMWQ